VVWRDLGAISARSRRDLGAISARSRRDLGAHSRLAWKWWKLPRLVTSSFASCAAFAFCSASYCSLACNVSARQP